MLASGKDKGNSTETIALQNSRIPFKIILCASGNQFVFLTMF